MNKFETIFSNHRTFLLLFMGILVVYGLSFYQRQADYSSFWMDNSQDYVVEDVTLLATNDGYYWVKMARELDKGTLGKGQKEITKGYPDLQMLAIQDTPSLLAVLISFAKNFHRWRLLPGGDLSGADPVRSVCLPAVLLFQ